MNFDLRDIATPFRMQPGLRRMTAGEPHLTLLDPQSPLALEKQQVLNAGRSRLCVPGFDAAPALAAIRARAVAELGSAAPAPSTPLELAFEEDFAVLDGVSGHVPWLCVCVPSRWAPEEKIGQSLAAIHAPVADADTLKAASQALIQLVTAGAHWERHVWTVTPSGRHDQHPLRHRASPWPPADDPAAFAAQCFLRSERQTFLPVPGHAQAVFTIRVHVQSLPDAVQGPVQARRLHDALASMSDAVLGYKGLSTAQAPLLSWLAPQAG